MDNYKSAPEETGLADELQQFNIYPASTEKRITNYLVDTIFLGLIANFVTSNAADAFLDLVFPNWVDWVNSDPNSARFKFFLLSYFIITIPHYLLYFTFCEKTFKGRTLGKLVSGTRAIRLDGKEVTWKDVFIRALSRLVPFEALSGFSYKPWHDRWSKTTVIDAK